MYLNDQRSLSIGPAMKIFIEIGKASACLKYFNPRRCLPLENWNLIVPLCLVVTLAACSKQDMGMDDLRSSQDSPEQRSIVLYSWAEYFNPEVLDEFHKTTGIKVDYRYYENNDEMFENLKSNSHQFHVVVMDDSSMERAIQLRLIQAIDRSLVPNFLNIDPKYAPDEEKASEFLVPYTWGTTLLAYRSDKLELSESEMSWRLLFDERNSGKISMLDERLECLGVGLRLLGYDANSGSSVEIQEATEFVVKNVIDKQIRFGSDNDMKEHLRSGISWVAMMYSGDAALVADESESKDYDISFFIPREGSTLWTDGFAVPRDCPSIEDAHRFINFMADAKIAGQTSNYLWYATPNRAALEEGYVNSELAADVHIYPPKQVLDRCDFAVEGDLERVRALNLGWRAVKEAVPDSLAIEASDASEANE